MSIIRQRGWDRPGRDVTPEAAFFSRRSAIGAVAAAGAAAGFGALGIRPAAANDTVPPGLPASAMRFNPGRPLTPANVAETYNNFYEFSTDKNLWQMAQAFPQRPWSIAFDGMVEKPFTIGIDELLKQVQIEERVYRHRCVEAWAMTVPWSGFPLAKLVALAKPTSSACAESTLVRQTRRASSCSTIRERSGICPKGPPISRSRQRNRAAPGMDVLGRSEP